MKVPGSLQGKGPLDNQAPFIEAVRTALAWVRIYYVVDNQNQGPLNIFFTDDQSIKQIQIPWVDLPTDKQRFCISGGAGFIGSALVKVLLQEGHQVIVLDNLLTSNLENLKSANENPNFLFVLHDVSMPFTIAGPLSAIIH